MSLTLEQYQPLALRTAKFFGSRNSDLVHVALGLASEHFEADVALAKRDYPAAREEIGDSLWYCALGAHVLGFNLSAVNLDPRAYTCTESTAIANFVSYVKRLAIYGKASTEAMDTQAIGDLHVIVAHLAARADRAAWVSNSTLTLGDVLQENIDKLRARYPDKYSDEAAEARADKGGLDARES